MQQVPSGFESASSIRSGPVLVTGSHRSGSTWVGNILALAPGTGYVHEPFNIKTRDGLCCAHFPTDFAYVTAENEAAWLPALQDTFAWRYAYAAELPTLRSPRDLARTIRDGAYFKLKQRAGARMIMKDPIALFSAEWLSDRFDMPVVTIIRHPAAFVSSLIAAGWAKFDFAKLVSQDRLMRDRLAPFRTEMEEAVSSQPDELDVGILLWRAMHHHIDLLRRDHPDWIFVRHEDLSLAPPVAFREIFDRLGLAYDDKVATRIGSISDKSGGLASLSIFGSRRRVVRDSKSNIQAWKKRLTEDQIARIRMRSEDVWPRFYSESEW